MSTEGATEHAELTEQVFDQLRRSETRLYPEAAIETIRQQPEQFIPELLACLERCVANVVGGNLEEVRGEPALLAFCLLIEFDVKEAWPITKQLIRLAEDGPFEVLGDGIHEILPTAICLWGMGELDELRELCLDTTVNEYCRCSISRAVCDGYARDFLTRDTMIEFHRHLLDHAATSDYELRGLVIANLLGVHADELRQSILEAFQKDLVDSFIVGVSSVVDELDGNREATVAKYQERLDSLENFTDQLKWWAGFQPLSEPKPIRREPTPTKPLPPVALPQQTTVVAHEPRIGRNDPCPCGSGKKYKKCCL